MRGSRDVSGAALADGLGFALGAEREPTGNDFEGCTQPRGTPMNVRRRTWTENWSVRSRMGESRVLRADLDTRVLHIAHEE